MNESTALLGMIALIGAATLFVLWQIQKNLTLQSKRQGKAHEELHQSLLSLTKAVEINNDRHLEQSAILQKSLVALHELILNSTTSEQVTLVRIHEAVKNGSFEQNQELQKLQEIFNSNSEIQVRQLIAVDSNLIAMKESLEESIKI
jgi:hypothetical protein